jgi:hypothetical protein
MAAQCQASNRPTTTVQGVAAYHARPADWATAWSSRGGGPRCGSGARASDALTAWLVRVFRWTTCPEKGSVSTVRVAAMRQTRWRHRGLTRVAARRAGAERRWRGDVPRWRRRSTHRWHRWWGPVVQEGKGKGEAHATCEPRRMEDRLTEEAKTRRQGWLGLPVARR